MQILSRKDAQRAGIGQYYTAKPCIHGHLSHRYTQSGACAACVAISSCRARGTEHDGNVRPHETLDRERIAKIAKMMAERDAKQEALMQLVEVRLLVHPQHVRIVLDTAVGLILNAFPCLERPEVMPPSHPVRGTPIYRIRLPVEHVGLIREIAAELWNSVPIDMTGIDQRRMDAVRLVDTPAPDWAEKP